MNATTLSIPYSCQARLSAGDIYEQRELKREELFPLLREQMDIANPLALRWGYSLLIIERVKWGKTVEGARQTRAKLCRAWSPETATLLDALRLAYLIDLSMTSAVEPLHLLLETLGPEEPLVGRELVDVIDFLTEARHETGPELFDDGWLRLCIGEPSYEPPLVPAAIVASWVAIHRRDLIGAITDGATRPIPEVEWDGSDPGFGLDAFALDATRSIAEPSQSGVREGEAK